MGGRKHLHAKSKYCPGHACQQTLERFRENIHDQTPLPQIKTSDCCIFFPSPLLPIFTTHNEYSGWLYTNPAMKRNSFIFPLYILPFHPLAIQPLPLSEQISQFNFIVACGLKIVSSLRNDCDNQIVRAHVYLTWQVAAQISSTRKWRALFVLVCVFFFLSVLQTHPEIWDASWVLSVLQHVTSNKGSAAQMKNFLTAL